MDEARIFVNGLAQHYEDRPERTWVANGFGFGGRFERNNTR